MANGWKTSLLAAYARANRVACRVISGLYHDQGDFPTESERHTLAHSMAGAFFHPYFVESPTTIPGHPGTASLPHAARRANALGGDDQPHSDPTRELEQVYRADRWCREGFPLGLYPRISKHMVSMPGYPGVYVRSECPVAGGDEPIRMGQVRDGLAQGAPPP